MFLVSEMDHVLLESSLLYHGTYLLDELHREQPVSIDKDCTQWFRNHLPHTVPPKSVHSAILLQFLAFLVIFCHWCILGQGWKLNWLGFRSNFSLVNNLCKVTLSRRLLSCPTLYAIEFSSLVFFYFRQLCKNNLICYSRVSCWCKVSLRTSLIFIN